MFWLRNKTNIFFGSKRTLNSRSEVHKFGVTKFVKKGTKKIRGIPSSVCDAFYANHILEWGSTLVHTSHPVHMSHRYDNDSRSVGLGSCVTLTHF